MISLITISFIINKSIFYSSLINSKPSRNASLDGFRGILALSVVIYHSNITYFYYINNEWGGIHNLYLSILGNGGVLFFFMITGFLFWEMVLRKNGLNDIKYYFSQRIKRLLPIFLVSLSFIFVVSFFQSNYSLIEIIHNIYNKILFLLHISNENLSVTGIENMSIINAGVFWTLVYEWKFYIIFPIISILFVHVFKMWKWFPMLSFLVIIFFQKDTIWLLFSLGMISATIKHQFKIRVNSKLTPYLLFFMIIGLFFIGKPYSLEWYLLAFSLFTLIFSLEIKVIKILEYKPLQLIGVMSYSIYLLHGIFLWVIFQFTDQYIPVRSISFEFYWLIIGLMIISLIFVSSQSFQYIENRFHHY